jgi:hypothetical protein
MEQKSLLYETSIASPFITIDPYTISSCLHPMEVDDKTARAILTLLPQYEAWQVEEFVTSTYIPRRSFSNVLTCKPRLDTHSV